MRVPKAGDTGSEATRFAGRIPTRGASIDPLVIDADGWIVRRKLCNGYRVSRGLRHGRRRASNPALADGGHNPAGVSLQRFTALGEEGELRDRLAVAELLVHRDESCRLEPSGMTGEIAVGQVRGLTKADEFLTILDGQSGEDAQSAGVGDKRVELHIRHYRTFGGRICNNPPGRR